MLEEKKKGNDDRDVSKVHQSLHTRDTRAASVYLCCVLPILQTEMYFSGFFERSTNVRLAYRAEILQENKSE